MKKQIKNPKIKLRKGDVISPFVGGWISVRDMDAPYPELGMAVMIHLKSGYISVGYRKLYEGSVSWQLFGDIAPLVQGDDYLTHWMPLPSPPTNGL